MTTSRLPIVAARRKVAPWEPTRLFPRSVIPMVGWRTMQLRTSTGCSPSSSRHPFSTSRGSPPGQGDCGPRIQEPAAGLFRSSWTTERSAEASQADAGVAPWNGLAIGLRRACLISRTLTRSASKGQAADCPRLRFGLVLNALCRTRPTAASATRRRPNPTGRRPAGSTSPVPARLSCLP